MDFFPIFFNIRNQPCLVVGGGDVAQRKVEMLLRAQAKITIVAPKLNEELERLVQARACFCHRRKFDGDDVQGKVLVIGATDNPAVNRRVSRAARMRHIPVNIVDNPDLSTFITPAVIDRDPLMIAVGSGGNAPVLSRLLRAKIESLIPARYGELARLAGRYRDQVKAVFDSVTDRRRFWENAMQGVPAELVLSGNQAAAEKLLNDQLANGALAAHSGEVYLVGAGPGDPDLLTFRALRLMQQADVVLYDRLVSPGVLDLVRRDAERIYVGKRRAEHTLQQLEINQLIVDLAKQGKRVLRLKGGDPFIFGRGGEEIEQLAAHDIPFQVVPGITAAAGCASYAGIPLTHRDYAQSVRFIAGHLRNGQTNLDFSALLDPKETLVFYMGLVGLPEICARLVEHGRAPNTPAALIEKGTTADQRVIVSTLAQLPDTVAKGDIHGPTLLIIGDVVRLHQQLKWFQPADGQKL